MTRAMQAFEDKMARGGMAAIDAATGFFMRDDPVNRSLRQVAGKLQELQIPYAISGGMALVAHGYDRTTVDVDILVTPEGLRAIHQQLEGLGYVTPFTNSKNLRDTGTGVRIEFLVTGQYPGDGKPKPIAFPDPAVAAVAIDGIRYLQLPRLVELKLASGMTNPGRLKDLADVQELIRSRKLPANFADQLHEYVRDMFRNLWQAVQASDEQET
jgi:hypothetical protein